MAIREIRTEGDEILNKVSKPVTSFDERLFVLLDDMKETLADKNGAGLAAVQVGVLKRVILVDVGDGPIEFINPKIIKTEGEEEKLEGCLSVPGVWGMVKRPKKVLVRAQDRHGKFFELEGEELMAQALCHETDHLDGHLYTEKVIRFVDPEEFEE